MSPLTIGLGGAVVFLIVALAFVLGKRDGTVAPVNATSAPSVPFNLLTFLNGYKTYIMAAATVAYGVGIDYSWWAHSLTLDSFLVGGNIAAWRSATKTNVAQIVNAVVKPTSPAAQAEAASVPEPKKLP